MNVTFEWYFADNLLVTRLFPKQGISAAKLRMSEQAGRVFSRDGNCLNKSAYPAHSRDLHKLRLGITMIQTGTLYTRKRDD